MPTTELQLATTVERARSMVAGRRVALVPTMGSLHAGHLALVRRARREADYVVVSLFVNPLQFGPNEDYGRYPRTLARDRQMLADEGVDLLFCPETDEMYVRPLGETTRVEVPGLSEVFCGASRPGHFAGVTTVVSMLFHLFQPELAVFGQKDYQQLLIIRRMVEDLRMPVRVLLEPTVREPDGLAMSSRNAYLTPAERERAPLLYRTLCDTRARLESGERDFDALESGAVRRLGERGFGPEYFAIRRAGDLGAPAAADTDLVVLAAARLGQSRLLDNVLTGESR
jgi:pantoate--beta-alanine ligase